jgi:hypothetical protein
MLHLRSQRFVMLQCKIFSARDDAFVMRKLIDPIAQQIVYWVHDSAM